MHVTNPLISQSTPSLEGGRFVTIYSQQCTFYGNGTLSNATIGWDVVYAVTYDMINKDLAERQPWVTDFGEDPGFFLQEDSGGNILSDAQVTGLSVSSGGQGEIVEFQLTIKSATLTIAGLNLEFALTDIVATIETTLVFQASPTTKGLHNLVVDASSPFNVTAVSGYNVTSAADIAGVQGVVLGNIISAFCTKFPKLFTGVYANVFTKDYAESVNIPWLQPAAFSYAVAPTATGNGILAVLGSVSGNTTGLTQQVTPLMFPTNANVNAAVAVSSTTLAEATFLTNLNSVIGQSEVGPMDVDVAGQILSNKDAISAFYAVDPVFGQVSFISNPAEAPANATTYPVTIPAGAITISFTADSITTAVTGAIVDLYGGIPKISQ